MPYIKNEQRQLIDSAIDSLIEQITEEGKLTPWDREGLVNYTITRIVDTMFNQPTIRYSEINSAIGVVECVKLELYRRLAAPYEDQKCFDNGEVYSDRTER